MHIDVGGRNRLDREHLAAELLEGSGEHVGELLCVRAAIMDRNCRLQVKHLPSVVGIEHAGVAVAVHRAHEAVVSRLAIGRRQRRRARRSADADDAGLPHDRRPWRRGAGAGGADHDHHVRCGRELGRRRLAALGVALVVFGVELDRMAEQRAAEIGDGNLGAALLVEAERRVGTGQHPIAADHDRRALGHADHADRVGDRPHLRGLRERRGQQQRRRQPGEARANDVQNLAHAISSRSVRWSRFRRSGFTRARPPAAAPCCAATAASLQRGRNASQ